jgi:rubrerythrin
MNGTVSSEYASQSPIPSGTCVDWDAVLRTPVSDETARALRYMADTESHTLIYLRELLATRAIDEPEVAEFFACWFYEETAHGRALGRFLRLAGHEPPTRLRSQQPWSARLEAVGIAWISALWRDFVAVHMTWGAINELTAVTAYRRLAERSGHPVLEVLLGHIRRDEARHFGFYYGQAERRLTSSPSARRIARVLVERFWGPVGSGVQPESETRFIGSYLFGGPGGREAAQTVDRTIRRLPGFDDVRLLEAWIERNVPSEVDNAVAGRVLRAQDAA